MSSTDTTGSTVVKRSNGNFSAGTITANALSGSAVSSTATTGNTVVKRSNGNFSAGTITANFIGMGTSNPIAPLDIRGSEELTGGGTHRDFTSSRALTYYSFEIDDQDVSIYCARWVASQRGFVAIQNAISSDERIKMDIQDIPDGESLNKLRQIEPKAYYYRDKTKAPHRRTFGFIAQQVENIIPEAVMTKKDYIPNILDLSTVSESNIITFSNFNTSNLVSNTSHLRITGIDGVDHDVVIVEVIDDKSIRVNTDLSEWVGSVDENGEVNTETGNNIFVRGERVDDYKILDSNYIWTVATAALQEVDRQLQAEKTKVSTLQSQLTSVLARLDALESA